MPNVSIACIAFHDKKIFIAHRNPVGQMGGRWEFPGGKLEDGENDCQAIVREMGEEFGVKVLVGEKITESSFFHCGKEVLLHVYRIFFPHDGTAEKFALTEHTEYKWVNVDEIPAENFVDSDLSILNDVKKYIEEHL